MPLIIVNLLLLIYMTFTNYQFTPGKKANLRLLLNKTFIRHYYNNFESSNEDSECNCIQEQKTINNQGWNDPSQTTNTRISRILTGTLGGRTTFGNFNRPVKIDYLGSTEGQSGGSFKPPRNKF
jgi:hypothetical protein